ncbi:MAG: hypothetical protein JNK18_05520 [Cyclobacteriaceae bacterium]|nr:hypothetical protein [Cyclobacteriaceae bacterium]
MKLVYTVVFVLVVRVAFSQGCSDAGFCTMGAMKPDQPYNKNIPIRLRSMEVSFYRGTTTLTPIVYVATLDASFSVGKKNSFQVKLPFQAVQGRLANTSGIGDISLCFTRTIYASEKFDVSVSLGSKIPTNKSNKTENGFPLPMYYQTSLGTYDAIAGISLVNRKWLFATGIQVPLNKNHNEFLWGRWAGSGEDPAYIEKYARANQLKRGIDVMLRVERNFRFSRLNFSVGMLPIYRITNDEIELPEGRVKPDGAKGLALSAIGTVGYSFNVKSGVKLLMGHKIVQRDENPDGLTRHLVSSVTYFYRF